MYLQKVVEINYTGVATALFLALLSPVLALYSYVKAQNYLQHLFCKKM